MTDAPYDPRSIANLMLDEGGRVGIGITNLAIQKLLYFAHAIYLIENKKPLVSGYFEAWQYGPVHPATYQAFKEAGDKPIEFMATGINIATGDKIEIPLPSDIYVKRHIQRIMNSYGRRTTSQLVDISHAKGAPWDFIVNKGKNSVAFGLRIPDDVIVERYKHHKVSVGEIPSYGELGEDTPLA